MIEKIPTTNPNPINRRQALAGAGIACMNRGRLSRRPLFIGEGMRTLTIPGLRVEMASARSCPAPGLRASAKHLEDYTKRKHTAMNCAASVLRLRGQHCAGLFLLWCVYCVLKKVRYRLKGYIQFPPSQETWRQHHEQP